MISSDAQHASPTPDAGPAVPDAEWLALTEGMEPYERFRYVARHVLIAALEEATGYVIDARIFEACEDEACIVEHLRSMERQLVEDDTLTTTEREFLCAAVGLALQERDLAARCPWDAFVRLTGGPRRLSAAASPAHDGQ